ncbi:hypothetical protein [Nocardioides sp. cx-173]|uniref:hypothetical protein n=1 Tax=Nocardioides sp. cx-173 TaxID=2898796 RepID=UPI001E5E1750|nr:hypothetical protein [Nocardioides sp. cx-173]MCD4523477.1 hypothetical protein [Nocardioides sp. cx-173]UGB42184.1 hypothetical protein LQ940_01330 [Nocardioides sp. cx-173]
MVTATVEFVVRSGSGRDANDGEVGAAYPPRSGISTAWLSINATSAQLKAFDKAWHLLRVEPEWDRWVTENLASGPFLYLAVRDDLEKQRLLKTKNGVSLHLPHAEVVDAEDEGTLVIFFQGVIRKIYEKWSRVDQRPDPPALP